MHEPTAWWPIRLARRARALARRRTLEQAMHDEMRDHIESEIADRIRRGATPDDARRSAMRDFGGVERHKEDARDARGFRPLDDAARDAVYALRVLRRNPGFTCAGVLTFALGIGFTCAIFSVVHGILLRPLPYAKPAELVALWERNAARGADHNVVSVAAFEAWRAQATSLAGIAAMVPKPATIAGSPAERITAAQVSPSFFRVLGVRPVIGRDFTSDDEANGGANVIILGDAMWRTRFGSDPGVVGRTMTMDGESWTIVGVMPPGFEPPRFGWMSEQPMWVPFAPTAGNRSWGRFLHVIGRRRAGASVERARAEANAIATRVARENGGSDEWSASVVPLAEQITGDVRQPLTVLFAAALLLLLIAVVNVASMMTTFTRRRRHELGVRRAIGATPFRLLRQQVAQSGILAIVGTGAGLVVAVVATRALTHLMPDNAPRLDGIRVDGVVLFFAAGVSALTAVLVACVATLRAASAAPLGLELRSAGRTTTHLNGGRIVTAEIAIGLVLSVLAALMVRSLANLRSVDLGFQTGSVATGRVSLPGDRYPNAERQRAFFDELVQRARAMPGVSAASVATTRPFACCAPSTIMWDAARSDSAIRAPTTDVRFVDASYFSALRVPVRAGASFDVGETREGPVRAVVSQSLAHALWGDRDPVGRSVSMKLFGTTTALVIGVVGDAHLADPRTPVRPAVYLSTNRFPSSERDLIVRGSGDGAALIASTRAVLASMDAAVPLYRATTLDESVGVALAQDRFTTWLLAGFALLAIVLAAVGVYGVLAGDVAQRRKEIGIRVALGATNGSVCGLMFRRMLAPVSSGVTIGIVVALVLSRSLASLVFGVGTFDPMSYAIVVCALTAVALCATLAPVVRATRVSPLEAIRTD